MKKFQSLNDFKEFLNKNTIKDLHSGIKIGMSTCGLAAGANRVYEEILEEIEKRNLNIPVKKCGCLGMCYAEPLVEVSIDKMPSVIYGKVDEQIARKIVEEHIINKKILHDSIYNFSFDKNYIDIDKKYLFIKDTTDDKNTRHYFALLEKEIENRGFRDKFQVIRVAEMGIYGKGCVIKIIPDDCLIENLQEKDIPSFIDSLVNNQLEKKSVKNLQVRIVLRNCGYIDPENINDYIATGGYLALTKCLFEISPEKIIDEIKKSGLRGRGGGGFPTWLKWKFTRETKSDEKYIICNADEGDPGAYMDRSVLEGDPHSVVEGMIIAAIAVGATKGYFYIRAEYPLAIERVNKAIKDAYEYGFLGENILGSNFSFDLEVRLGAGAFVCGEETALIASIEGKRGTPRPRPPYPSIKGLWDKPTVINNVETLANVPIIISKGGEWFASFGTETSKGTKVFALTGKIKNSGLIEVPMGITLKEIIYDIGGGTINNVPVKAVQTGGPSGGVIKADKFDTPVDYENLQKLGSIMGSGGMIVIDASDCIVDIAKFYLRFCVDESCGKCAPCRIGGYQMLTLLNDITDGRGTPKHIELLKKIATAMQKASLCGLGQTAANPVLSTLRYFEDEYMAHIKDKKCPAGRCQRLISYTILQLKCVKCGLCFRSCPVNAITGNKESGYLIDKTKCIKCGICYDVCKFNAIKKE